MAAYDALPRKVRAVVRELPVWVSASHVLEAVNQYGVVETLAALADIAEHPPDAA